MGGAGNSAIRCLRSESRRFVSCIYSDYLCAMLPALRMLASVYGKNDDVISRQAEINRVRKTEENSPACFAVYGRKCQWVVNNADNRVAHCDSELSAKTKLPLFVPLPRLQDFILSLRSKVETASHSPRCSLRRTASQGIAEPGFAMCSAQRRSSSTRCSGVSSSSR